MVYFLKLSVQCSAWQKKAKLLRTNSRTNCQQNSKTVCRKICFLPCWFRKGFKLAGHCFYDCCCNVLTIFLSVTFYCLQNIRWSTGVFGQLDGGTNGGYSPPRRRIWKPRPNHRRTTHWRRRLVPYGLISRYRRPTRCRPPQLDPLSS